MVSTAIRQRELHIKGFAAPETKAAVERVKLLIEQAEAIGEPPEDPSLLYSGPLAGVSAAAAGGSTISQPR